MADFTPVALGVKPPQGMSLSELLNMANQVQQYQQAQQINPLQVERATEEVKQSKIKSESDQYSFLERKMKGLADSQIRLINNPLVLKAEQDPQGVDKNALLKTIKDAGYAKARDLNIPKDEADRLMAQYIQTAETSPQGLRQLLKEKHLEFLDATARTGAVAASGTPINTGAGGYTVQTGEFGPSPAGTIVKGTAFNQQIGPNQKTEPTGRVDPAGNPTAYVKDAQGNILGEIAIPAGVTPSAATPGGAPPVRMPFETGPTVEAARNIQLNANKAAMGVQASQFNNNTIVKLADKALVGANAETLSKLGGGFAAVPWSSDATDNRQKLGHQLALETANLASGAGLGTDAARGLAEKMAGTTDWTPEAIKSTARMNRSLTTGSDMFNRGVNAAVAAAGNNPIAARDFQNKWSTQPNLIPTLQFVDAMRNAKDDPEGAKKTIQSLGGYGSDKYKEMLQRAGRLNDLITKGQ